MVKAQQYERSWWGNVANEIENGAAKQLDWYPWKAIQLKKRIAVFLNEVSKQTTRVLEIGSGPIGIANFLEWGESYAIDLLEEFYKAGSALTRLRDPRVTYLQGTGEHLSFPD